MEYVTGIRNTNCKRGNVLRIGYPFDSHVTYDENGTPVYDRAITSAPLRKLIKSLFSDGVLPNPATNLQVIAGNGMNVLVQPGFAMVNGCLKLEEAQRILSIQASDASYDRIDTVVMRLNDNDAERICDLYVVKGVPAAKPVRPELIRNASVWEIGLADLFISKNNTIISNQKITDTRYETERCGIISSVSKFDTTTLYQQIQSDLLGFKNEEQEQFLEWFKEVKDQLSEDAAGNLQAQINDLEQKRFQRRNGGDIDIDTLLGDDVQGRYWINPSVSEGSHPFSSYYTLLSFTDLQLALNGNGKVALRTYVNDKWDEWTKYYSAIEVDMMVNKSISGISDKNTIEANSSKNITITYNIPEGFEISHVNVKSTGFAGLIVQGSIVNRTTNKVIFVVYNATSVLRECTLETEVFYRLKQ